MKLVLSRFVSGDVQVVSDWIAKDSPERALTLVRELRAEFETIARNPFAFQVRPELGRERRIAVVRRYVVVFRVQSDCVYILRVVHGMRNLAALLRT